MPNFTCPFIDHDNQIVRTAQHNGCRAEQQNSGQYKALVGHLTQRIFDQKNGNVSSRLRDFEWSARSATGRYYSWPFAYVCRALQLVLTVKRRKSVSKVLLSSGSTEKQRNYGWTATKFRSSGLVTNSRCSLHVPRQGQIMHRGVINSPGCSAIWQNHARTLSDSQGLANYAISVVSWLITAIRHIL